MFPKNTLKTYLDKDILPVTAQINSQGILTIGGCSINNLEKEFGTPLYVIDEVTFRTKCEGYLKAFKKYYEDFLITYAAKAFACKKIFKLVNEYGFGLDVVSGGELHTAVKSGFNSHNIYLHGNNKTREEIKSAVNYSIAGIICDNFHDLEQINSISELTNKEIPILIRLTPGIECHTHEYIKTGHLNSKFGFDPEELDKVLNLIKTNKKLLLKGLHAHIGSQIFELNPYRDTVAFLIEALVKIKREYKTEISNINIGGGLGIAYTLDDDPLSIDEWAYTITKEIKDKCTKHNLNFPKLICEPGRSIVAQAGVTLYKAGSIKQVPGGSKFIAVDGGMADNPRPITYQAQYTALVGNKITSDNFAQEKVTIAGRYCESGDILVKDATLPKIDPGDLIIICCTGAYNYSMSSNYNLVPRPACILVKNGKSELIIERETYDDLIAKQK